MAPRGQIVGIDGPETLERALRSAFYLADDGLATAAYLALALGKPLLLEGAPGVGKTEAAKAIAGVLARRADPPAMLRRHRCRDRALRMELSAPDAGDPPGRRPADRHLSRRVPDRAADARSAARAGRGRAADRRDRPLGSRVRGVPARVPLRLPDLDPRARHACARTSGRW